MNSSWRGTKVYNPLLFTQYKGDYIPKYDLERSDAGVWGEGLFRLWLLTIEIHRPKPEQRASDVAGCVVDL